LAFSKSLLVIFGPRCWRLLLIRGLGTKGLVKRILREFPDLHIDSARLVRAGWDNVVVDVNDQWIFRFPRFKVAENSLKREIKLLVLLKGQLPIRIPDYEYVAPTRKSGYSFGGYRKIVGNPATQRGYRNTWTRILAKGLASFLREVHTPGIARIMSEIFPVWNQKKRLRKHWREARALGYKYLDTETRRLSELFFQKGVETFDNASYQPLFVHGDLTDRNILVNARTGKATGILDWGDSAIMDPAIDFAGLFELNRELGYATLDAYGHESDDFRARVEVYWRLLPYFEILYGIYSNIPKLREIGVERLRKRLEAPSLYSG
jgi:aminoglycoside 2''-phosphotransferase